ncbi:MAG: hypothetical protein IIC29_00975 [Chloroflexi bacterium]|nr:hypothetical protein [Chloroflexota bacterium]MCH8234678.1 hypothetical protein [Chloroflexota bacterium]MCH8817312.1 hypothetical protein [Chloroflexota bacterium]
MLALVAARREELAAVIRLRAWRQRRAPEGALAYQRRDHAVSALLTGAGRDQTERAMAWLLESERPEAILAIGFAGACSTNLNVGDLVLATRLHHIEGSPFDWDSDSLDQTPGSAVSDPPSEQSALGELAPDPDMLDQARAAVEMNGIDFMPSPILTVNSLVRTSGLAAWLGETYGVSAVDRESYWVAAAAAAAGVPCLSVRAIVYAADETLPRVASELPDTPSGGRFGPLLRHGVRHPRDLWRHMRALRTARTAVATFADVLMNGDNLSRRMDS